MECIEARALKKSTFLSELAVNSSRESFIEEFVFVNGVTNDDFSVDAFFDFSNEDFKEEENLSLSTSEEEGYDTWQFSGASQSEVLPAGDLSVPVDDMENLEWLSQIVDDSASELSLLCPAGTFIPKSGFEPPVRTHSPVLCFPSTVPAKARTKRARTGGRSWSGGSPESSGDCSPTSTLIFSNPAKTGWYPYHPVCAGFDGQDSSSEEVMKPPLPASKRGRKRPAGGDDVDSAPPPHRKRPAAGNGAESVPPPLLLRRCSHCQVQKTPQWRNGPQGPKTLCNACGVRFKSGRLFPEYRPACSPTYLGDVHSNSHRKVLEMRRKKEVGLV